MQLLFLRHGPAEARNDWRGDDEERPLSAQGKLLVADVAFSLTRQQTRPAVILTSPFLRAKQTAEIVSEHLGDGTQVLVDDRLAPGLGPKQLAKILRNYGDNAVLMLVAHDPDVSELVRKHSTVGLGVDRAYEQGEILLLPRLIIENIFPPAACNPHIRQVRFNVLHGLPIQQHNMEHLTEQLRVTAHQAPIRGGSTMRLT